MYLCIVFMVLDLRLKEDWLSGDNQFFFVAVRSTAMKHNQQKLKALWN